MLWTVATTDEYPPEDMAAFERMKRERRGLAAGVQEIVAAVREMPRTMKQLAAVQFFTWLGLFCMWLFYVPAVARHVFGAVDAQSEIYTRGVEWGNFTFSIYSIVCFLVAFALPRFAAATSRKTVHATALRLRQRRPAVRVGDPRTVAAGAVDVRRGRGVGVHPVHAVRDPRGLASGGAASGVYMGVFNFFIVLPEILQALTFGPLIRTAFGEGNPNAPVYVVLIGGCCLAVAALLVSAW